jgi:Baseplate J-like protein
MIYSCCSDHRREAVLNHSTLNGIDFLEVRGEQQPGDDQRQRVLEVHFIKSLGSNVPQKEDISIKGGERIRNVAVIDAVVGMGSQSNILIVLVDKAGDFSTYTLQVQQAPSHLLFDPLLSSIDFSFKVECSNDFDCQVTSICSPEQLIEPEINYLAKDYASFRQLMLDRIAVLVPQWSERNPADLGIVLVELLAYVGDYLSYQQDAIATEAYLGTARRRISVRRHARLVDYYMHDGCNARTWIYIQVDMDIVKQHKDDPSPLPSGTQLLTTIPGQSPLIAPDSFEYNQALNVQPEIFETLQDIDGLFQGHNELHFYTWGADECCLPQGATVAILYGNLASTLQKGDVLIFEEVLGPNTGQPEDADPSHRHAVRLSGVIAMQDPLGGQFADVPNDSPVDITQIEWSTEDALPFPLCISSRQDAANGGPLIANVSVARGNIVLADHGRTIKPDETLGPVLSPTLYKVPALNGDLCRTVTASSVDHCGGSVANGRCAPSTPIPIIPRFRPDLREGPLTQAATITITDPNTGMTQRLPFDPGASASAALNRDMQDVIPAITLNDQVWQPRRDLLGSDPSATDFVAEVEADGTTYLRFGDGQHGLRPAPGTLFTAHYRIGNGTRGNVGIDTITSIVCNLPNITAVRNPLPARGGVDPESIEDVRQKAPDAFRTQERAVTPDDYAEVARRHPEVLRAAATFHWTGSWHTVFLAIDRLGGAQVDEDFKKTMRQFMELYRMAGYDLEIDGPIYVSLEIDMTVSVKPDYFRSNIKATLLQIFSNSILPDGRRGVFHPDNFTFGQTIYLSPIYSAAQAVAGVDFVQVTTFQRQNLSGPQGAAATTCSDILAQGKLKLGRLEIARLDNDPNFPEHGVFRLTMEGGK